jgi:hypothetical protein
MMRSIALAFLILLAIIGCVSNRRRAPEIIDQVQIEYVFNDSIGFKGKYKNGDLDAYVVQNLSDSSIKSELKYIQGNEKAEIEYGKGRDTLSIKFFNSKGLLKNERSWYSNGALKKEISMKNGLFDTSYYQIDGVTKRINKNVIGDSTLIVENDSMGNRVEEQKYYFRDLVETKRYVNNDMVYHMIKSKDQIDTLLNKDHDNGRRSANDIMGVVRTETPKLRHLYNRYLLIYKYNSKISLKFEINNNGDVVYIYPTKFTTSTPLGFINDVAKNVGSWKYSKVSRGNTTVVIPFTFSE